MIDQNLFEKNRNFHGVKGMVYLGDKILVYRRDGNTDSFPFHIDLPGGGKEDAESPFDTFKRELKEEFGINISKEDINYSKQYMSIMDPNKESYFVVTRPLNLKISEIVFGNEGLGFLLIPPDEYVNLNDGIKRQQDKVAEYLETLKK